MGKNVEQYDTIFVGYPIWWDRAPAMINTFFIISNNTTSNRKNCI